MGSGRVGPSQAEKRWAESDRQGPGPSRFEADMFPKGPGRHVGWAESGRQSDRPRSGRLSARVELTVGRSEQQSGLFKNYREAAPPGAPHPSGPPGIAVTMTLHLVAVPQIQGAHGACGHSGLLPGGDSAMVVNFQGLVADWLQGADRRVEQRPPDRRTLTKPPRMALTCDLARPGNGRPRVATGGHALPRQRRADHQGRRGAIGPPREPGPTWPARTS